MASSIRIKRSSLTAVPPSLEPGELAYSEVSDALFIGETNGLVTKIGGESEVALNTAQDGRLDTLESRADANDTKNQSQDDALAAETQARTDADAAQDASLTQYKTDQAAKDASQDAALAQEVLDRQAGDQAQADALAAETQARTDADTALDGRVTNIETTYVNLSGDQTITGSKTFSSGTTTIENLVVTGTRSEVNSTDLVVQDRLVTYNAGETGDGVTGVTSGFEVDRGTLDSASLVFDESQNAFFVDYGDGAGSRQIATTGDALYTTEADGGIDAAKLAQQIIVVDGTVARNDRDNNFSADQTFQLNVIGNGTTSELNGFIVDGGTF